MSSLAHPGVPALPQGRTCAAAALARHPSRGGSPSKPHGETHLQRTLPSIASTPSPRGWRPVGHGRGMHMSWSERTHLRDLVWLMLTTAGNAATDDAAPPLDLHSDASRSTGQRSAARLRSWPISGSCTVGGAHARTPSAAATSRAPTLHLTSMSAMPSGSWRAPEKGPHRRANGKGQISVSLGSPLLTTARSHGDRPDRMPLVEAVGRTLP